MVALEAVFSPLDPFSARLLARQGAFEIVRFDFQI